MAAVAGLALGIAATQTPHAAHASDAVGTCALALVLNFEPPLTADHPSAISTGHGIMTNCTAGPHNADVANWGTATLITPSGHLDCANFSLRVTGDGKWVWNTHETSYFTFVVDTDPANLQAEAVVTAGPWHGGHSDAFGLFSANDDCPSRGLATLSIPVATAHFS